MPKPPMIEVLSVASEMYPLIKTGGLADVTGALPRALSAHGVAMRTLIPGYPAVIGKLSNVQAVARLDDLFGGKGRLLAARVADADLLVLDAPHLYDRPGNPYVGPPGTDWPDNWKRYAALSWTAHRLSQGLVADYAPQLIHAHDWQAGLVPAYVKYTSSSSRPCTVMTVHNQAFQGWFDAEIFGELRLPPQAFEIDGVEYHGGVGFLKAGLQCADAVTTVSPTYAEEIRTPAFGLGLEGLLNHRAESVHGILNGIDVDTWNPATDPALARHYGMATVRQRRVNKTALAEKFALDGVDGPLFSVISRLTWQKGIDLIVACVDRLVAMGGRLIVLGAGEAPLEQALHDAAARHPGKIGVVIGYDETLAHRIQGGADVMLVPSRFEPCGLTQLYGLRYGCVPLVSRTGGLADTVIDANHAALAAGVATGIQFTPDSEQALAGALQRAVRLFADPRTWQRMQRRGMQTDVSWEASAKRYAALYADLLSPSGTPAPAR